ncbi:melanoma-associated antigen B16-like [Bubalus kerabau]|uniref:melanoma-associated antigen B16-like n=1 Tax=Bubalus carabanensis TaxID=3119969 RepID=UPI00244EE5DE|nr:melanoma-associated antigen B16-like [Bubalus carabanensis]XP_055420162.1 melanoma-associated antigen B16-like [Bubalus carabanensis]
MPPVRIKLSKRHTSSRRAQHQSHQASTQSQNLEMAQLSRALEETHLLPHPQMPGNSKEAPGGDKPSTPEGPQSFSASSIGITASASSKSSEVSMNQGEENSPGTSEAVPGTSEAVPDFMNVPVDALDSKIAVLVNFLLFKYQMKEPVTKADMLQVVNNDCEVHFPEILLRASERIEMLFGLDLKEVDPTNHCYGIFIKSGLTYDGMMHGEAGVPKVGILILILGVIFMKGNCATEEEVWEVLNVTGLYSGKKHFIFGEPKQLITEHFVREGYLEFRQVASADPAQSEFLWGPRAHAETTKMKVLKFIAKVHGTDPSSFPSQYEEALQEEKEKAQASISAKGLRHSKV